MPAENLHYRQVVLLKGNLMAAAKGGKDFVIRFPHKDTFRQVRAANPWLTRLLLGSTTVTVHICGDVTFFFFSKILLQDISWRRASGEGSPLCVLSQAWRGSALPLVTSVSLCVPATVL